MKVFWTDFALLNQTRRIRGVCPSLVVLQRRTKAVVANEGDLILKTEYINTTLILPYQS